jgi:bud emergence protein 1
MVTDLNLASLRSSRASTFGSPKEGSSPTSPTVKTQVFYAVVQHDFAAERPDELEAKAGDPISVVAQSNREWFVAKPIGRLGRPGLIPVSFVEVRDPITNQPIRDVNALIDQGALPKVEEWKRQMLNYKATSISLGVLDDSSTKSGVSNSPYMPKSASVPASLLSSSFSPESAYPPQPQPQPADEGQALPEGVLLSAEVVSFHSEMDEYWFRIHVIFQPYNPNGSFDLPPAKQHILYRCYNDFYDFQIDLLETFPREAGREVNSSPRLIPYMPGPVEHVDDEITLTRKDELDKYLRSLCKLKETTAKYILESMVVRKFLAIKPGDAEMDIDPCIEDIQAIFGAGDPPDGYPQELPHDDTNGLHDQMGRMNLNGGYDNGYDNGNPHSNSRAHDPHNYNEGVYDPRDKQSSRHPFASQNHQRSGSTVSYQRTSTYSSSPGNSPQPAPTKPQWAQNHPYSAGGWNHTNGHDHDDRFGNDQGRTSVASATSPTSARSSQPHAKSRSRSQSNATKLNSPPISATNPQTAFVKIKIFDSITDDLIAIRVHPRVTHTQLMEKIQSRLGAGVKNLKYRESAGGAFVELLDDEELRTWIEATDRHVLYAD